MQQLQAQLDVNEKNKSLDLVCVKKRLEDYEHMLQYYTLMWINNNMKDFDAKSKEWWEVAEEYFAKELEKIWTNTELMRECTSTSLRYIKKKFQILYVEVQQAQKHRAKMRRMKHGPMTQLKRRRCKLKIHRYSREEAKKRKNHIWIKNKNKCTH